MTVDHFADRAAAYEQNPGRVDNVANIANAILGRFPLRADMRLLDFGAGTGLLLERLAPHVAHITALDASPSMTRQLEDKRARLACPVDIVVAELEAGPAPTPGGHGGGDGDGGGDGSHSPASVSGPFDGIVSSMALHHVRDTAALLARFHAMLRAGGFVALADLVSEDGSFHSKPDGVFHHGFAPDALAGLARAAGFREVATATVSAITKDRGSYPVFLLTGLR